MEQVQLSDFIRNTLTQIAMGVRGANDELKNSMGLESEVFSLRHNLGDDSRIPGIKFDVEVTTASGQKDKAGFLVTLVNIGGGASTEKSKGHEGIHRIQFEIGIQNMWY